MPKRRLSERRGEVARVVAVEAIDVPVEMNLMTTAIAAIRRIGYYSSHDRDQAVRSLAAYFGYDVVKRPVPEGRLEVKL